MAFKQKIVLSAATAGSNRRALEEGASSLAASQLKRKLQIINFTDEIVESCKLLNKDITPSNIPNLDSKTLTLAKEHAIKRILEKINALSNTDFIIESHLSYWWKDGPMQVLGYHDVLKLRPDMIITVISSPDEAVKRLKESADWRNRHVDEYDIALWAEVETFAADLLSEALNIQNYVIGNKENPITLFDLIYRPYRMKVYVSYAISHREADFEALNKFIEKLRKHVTVFDPKSIDISAYATKSKGRVKRTIYNQTVRRDFHLIDQSDAVVIHFPTLTYSSGVDAERMHAYMNGKPVLMYFPFSSYSPFTPFFVDKVYRTENALLKDLIEMSKEIESKNKKSL
jgi:adenylate kinase